MAGKGPSPKRERANKADVPIRGEIRSAPGSGWQHGKLDPPDGLMPASIDAWQTWMTAWFAAFWTPEDAPGLRQIIRLYDQVERGEFQRASELRLQMDTYGITPKGQQDRRWSKPEEKPAQTTGPAGGGRYSHLKAV